VDNRGMTWMSGDWHGKVTEGRHILLQRLDMIPYQEEPWKSRYPELAEIMDGNPGAPAGNVVRDNVFVKSGEPNFADDALEFSEIGENYSTDSSQEFAGPEAGDYSLTSESPVFDALPDFDAIPFDKIGVQKGE
jgi:hypothetical protein